MTPKTSTPATETLQYLRQPYGELAWLIYARAAYQPERVAPDLSREEQLGVAAVLDADPQWQWLAY